MKKAIKENIAIILWIISTLIALSLMGYAIKLVFLS